MTNMKETGHSGPSLDDVLENGIMLAQGSFMAQVEQGVANGVSSRREGAEAQDIQTKT